MAISLISKLRAGKYHLIDNLSKKEWKVLSKLIDLTTKKNGSVSNKKIAGELSLKIAEVEAIRHNLSKKIDILKKGF